MKIEILVLLSTKLKRLLLTLFCFSHFSHITHLDHPILMSNEVLEMYGEIRPYIGLCFVVDGRNKKEANILVYEDIIPYLGLTK